jgi:Ni,Fe-hydrogenase III small subunit
MCSAWYAKLAQAPIKYREARRLKLPNRRRGARSGHADGLVLTGPLTRAMAEAVTLTWEAMPEPRFLVSFGACALSGGLYASSEVLDRTFLERFAPALRVPGCPPHPLTFITGVLDLLGIR